MADNNETAGSNPVPGFGSNGKPDSGGTPDKGNQPDKGSKPDKGSSPAQGTGGTDSAGAESFGNALNASEGSEAGIGVGGIGGAGVAEGGMSSAVGGGDGLAGAAGAAEGAAAGAEGASAAAGGTSAAGQAKGYVDDVKQAAAGYSSGDVEEGTDAVVRGGATAAATYFGGIEGGAAARQVLNTGVGKKVTRVASWGVIGSVVIVMCVVVLIISTVVGVNNATTGITTGLVAACDNGNVVVGPGVPSQQNPSREQVAATIYSQAKGLGLDDVAALAGIFTGISEASLTNTPVGDMWYGGTQMTPSRGVFQQMGGWAPPGTAWSGQKVPGAPGVGTNAWNGTNAWTTPGGWALTDPRMNVAQSANLFFLGPEYQYTAGLEDSKAYQSIYGHDPATVDSGTLGNIVHDVQGYRSSQSQYDANIPEARKLLSEIKSGVIPVPPYQAPTAAIAKHATTSWT